MRSRPLLGTYVEIGVPGDGNAATDRAITCAFEAVGHVHSLLSFQEAGSALRAVNAAPMVWHDLPPAFARVLRLSLLMMRRSGGLFNPTVGGALIAEGALPGCGDDLPLPYGTADDIELIGNCVRLRRPLALTFDGIAKGYAVDRAVKALRQAGMRAGWVNAGGDMRAFGDHAIPVSRREADGSLRPIGALQNGAIATSLVAPHAGDRFPSLTVSAGAGVPMPGVWTVSARYAWQADALTKIAALAAPQHRVALIRALHGALIAGPQEVAA
nr:FAD:protein FMN transferase [Kordiimonas marina]